MCSICCGADGVAEDDGGGDLREGKFLGQTPALLALQGVAAGPEGGGRRQGVAPGRPRSDAPTAAAAAGGVLGQPGIVG